MILLFNIIFTLLFTNNFNSEIDQYLQKNLSDFSRIEYEIVSPKNIDKLKMVIDEERDMKRSRNYIYVPVQIVTNNSKSNSTMTLKVKGYQKVLVANRKILRDEELMKYDFTIIEKEISALRSEPITDLSIISMYRSRLNMQEGTILEKNMIEPIPAVIVGDHVDGIFNNGSVNISFRVVARSEGGIGEKINVKRDDNRIFKAIVLNENQVKIIE